MKECSERALTCCFTGHRPCRLPWQENENAPGCIALKRRIVQELEKLYDQGFRHFMCGMALGCDFYFAEAVLFLRTRKPDITLEAVIPCETQPDSWSPQEQNRYLHILSRCDHETMIQRTYTWDCMRRRNRYMVERSKLVMAVYDGMGQGGTMYTLNYALDRNVEILIVPVERV